MKSSKNLEDLDVPEKYKMSLPTFQTCVGALTVYQDVRNPPQGLKRFREKLSSIPTQAALDPAAQT